MRPMYGIFIYMYLHEWHCFLWYMKVNIPYMEHMGYKRVVYVP